MSSTHASVGILIIGSLYWDDETTREKWRQKRLDLNKTTCISAPIRYGRRSRSRGCSYTMVFSEQLNRDPARLGTAIVVPCKRPASSIEDLMDEAEWLWAAENKSKKSTRVISREWGRVVIKTNPNREIPKEFLQGWNTTVSKNNSCGLMKHACDEVPIVNEAGILNIDWPSKQDGNALDLDILLATATDPTIGADRQYPNAKEIADAWKNENGRCYGNYFWCNKKHNITTFQDVEIQQYLSDK